MIRSILSLSFVVLAASALDTDAQAVFPGIGQFYYNGVPQNWSDAYRTCKSGGGHLAVINSATEHGILLTLLDQYSASDIHLGFHDKYEEGVYKTITGEMVDESCEAQWADGEPSSGADLNCGWLMTGGIGVGDCSLEKTSICELQLWDDYTTVGDFGRYKLHLENRTWQQANEICSSEGSHLLIVNSEAECDALYELYPDLGDVWVGAHRLYGDDIFVTLFNEPLENTGFSTWYPGNPNGNSVTKPFMALHYTPGAYGFHDIPAAAMGSFICEHAIHSGY